MKKIILAIAVCLSLILTGANLASAKAKTTTTTPKAGGKASSVSGTIKTVNSHILMLTTSDSTGIKGYNLSPATTVTINGKEGTLADLASGQSVTVAVSGYKVTSVTVNN